MAERPDTGDDGFTDEEEANLWGIDPMDQTITRGEARNEPCNARARLIPVSGIGSTVLTP